MEHNLHIQPRLKPVHDSSFLTNQIQLLFAIVRLYLVVYDGEPVSEKNDRVIENTVKLRYQSFNSEPAILSPINAQKWTLVH